VAQRGGSANRAARRELPTSPGAVTSSFVGDAEQDRTADRGCLASGVLKAASTAPHGELKRYPIGHFDIYIGGRFERAAADQANFLTRHLLGRKQSSPATP
jgi:hypothetical protein